MAACMRCSVPFAISPPYSFRMRSLICTFFFSLVVFLPALEDAADDVLPNPA